MEDNKKSYVITNNTMLDNGDGTSDIWHITQMNKDISMDEIILHKKELKKLYLVIGEILLGE